MIPVLLIDDDRELANLLEEYLQEEFQLQAEYDGASGLEQALHHSYAVVILDLMLPAHERARGPQTAP